MTSSRITQILGVHLGTTRNWDLVRSEIISSFLPSRVREKLLTSHVLNRFQFSSENLNNYIMSVVAAADILGYDGTEVQLVYRKLQNIQPRIKAHLIASKSDSVQDLLSLAATVAEPVAVEEQLKLLTMDTQKEKAHGSAAKNMVVAAASGRRMRCWERGA
jgi:hypothetical protein